MCGRFSITNNADALENRFGAKFEGGYRPRYNAAPSQSLPVIFNEDEHTIRFARWGLLSEWAKKIRRDGIINVRTDTLVEKPTFKSDLRERRCLILSDGFYEWYRHGTYKTPYRFVLRSGEPFAFAGIWEENRTPAGEPVRTFAIVTTEANGLVRRIHDRMPVILPRYSEHKWLEEGDVSLLRPYVAKEMKAYRVSTALNSARVDEPVLIELSKT